MMGYGYGNYGYYPMEYGIVGGIVHLILWVLIILLIVMIIRRVMWGPRGRWMHHGDWTMGGSTPLDILKERYAKGEIDKVEYEERKKVLEIK